MRLSLAQLEAGSIAAPADHDDEVLTFAVNELQRYIRQMTGVVLPIVSQSDTTADQLIWLHVSPRAAGSGDGFTVRVSSTMVTLASASSRGLLYAVYALLEQLGCSWVHPGPNEHIVPRLTEFALPDGTIKEQPRIEHRGMALYGLYADTAELGRHMIDWMAKNRLNLLLTSHDRPDRTDTQTMKWPQVSHVLLPELIRRGIILHMSEHSTHYFLPRDKFDTHPEWFALVGGRRRPGQMCYSNNDGVQYVGRRLAEFAQQHPEIGMLGPWPLDGDGYCECAACMDPQTVFNATVKMGALVHAVRPDIIIEHLAYKPQSRAIPTTDIPDYMSALVCNRLDESAREWADAMKHKGGAYYFEYKMADHYHWAANVWLQPHNVVEATNTAVHIGYRGIIPLFLPMYSWWHTSLNAHFYARACWSASIDTATEMANYCRAYYGPLADDVMDIFARITNELHDPELLADRQYGSADSQTSAAPAVHRSRQAGAVILARLHTLEEVPVDPVIRQRLRRLRVYVQYFLLNYTYRSMSPGPNRDEAFDAWCAYAAEYAGAELGVCVYPEFIRWRRTH